MLRLLRVFGAVILVALCQSWPATAWAQTDEDRFYEAFYRGDMAEALRILETHESEQWADYLLIQVHSLNFLPDHFDESRVKELRQRDHYRCHHARLDLQADYACFYYSQGLVFRDFISGYFDYRLDDLPGSTEASYESFRKVGLMFMLGASSRIRHSMMGRGRGFEDLNLTWEQRLVLNRVHVLSLYFYVTTLYARKYPQRMIDFFRDGAEEKPWSHFVLYKPMTMFGVHAAQARHNDRLNGNKYAAAWKNRLKSEFVPPHKWGLPPEPSKDPQQGLREIRDYYLKVFERHAALGETDAMAFDDETLICIAELAGFKRVLTASPLFEACREYYADPDVELVR